MRPPAATASATATGPQREAAAPNGAAEHPKRRRSEGLLVWALLALIVAAGLALRFWHYDYGLPYVYNYDEANHFVSHSVSMLAGNGFDPGYYQNPTGFTYLAYVALRLVFGVFGVGLAEGSLVRQYAFDPTAIWEVGRGLAAVLGTAGVVATFLVARRFWGARAALVAAALLAFAFLPVTYSRIAVTDVGTFVPVALALYGALRVYEDGRLVHYLIAGAGAGVACGFKYTAGLVVLPLLVAGGVRIWRDRGTPWLHRRELRYLVGAGALLVACFAVTTPFFFAKPVSALYQLKTQAQAAGDSEKLGQAQQGGFSYYIESFTWGFGWLASLLALAGAAIEVRRDRVRGILLAVFPLALFLYMGLQTRYFGRWLLPMYPVLATLAGIAVARIAELVPGRRWVGAALAAAIAAVVLIQPLAADVRTAEVLGRVDTRESARDWLVAHYPKGLRVVIEPAVPDLWYRGAGNHSPKRQFVRGFVRDIRRQQTVDAPLGADTTYASTLEPQLIDAYRQEGFCTVVTMSLIRGRAENASVPQALAYYQRLDREATRLYSVSPFEPGRKPVPLHYDFSYDYYPTAYERPGAIVDVYRLNRCTQRYGRVPSRPYGDSGLEKGMGTSYPVAGK